MYRLLPWNWIGPALAIIIALALFADEVGEMIDVIIPDHVVVRYFPVILIGLLTLSFRPIGRWAPWRCVWRVFPFFNKAIFPDLNGVWLGSTSSNWPTLERMLDASQAAGGITQGELHSIPEQTDAMAIEIKASLFKVQITAGLSATNGQSHSITVRPWKDGHQRLHLTYVYQQDTPNPAMTDVDTHLGAADLVLDMDDFEKAEGVYWTRRNWKTGLNTAGRLEIRRIQAWKDKNKTLRDYAIDERERLAD